MGSRHRRGDHGDPARRRRPCPQREPARGSVGAARPRRAAAPAGRTPVAVPAQARTRATDATLDGGDRPDRHGRAAGIGVVLVALNPKNLLLCVAAGAAIASGDLSAVQRLAAVTVFTMVAASTVAVPVAAFGLGRTRVTGQLQALRGWLTAHSDAVLATLLLIIGAVLVGEGLSALR